MRAPTVIPVRTLPLFQTIYRLLTKLSYIHTHTHPVGGPNQGPPTCGPPTLDARQRGAPCGTNPGEPHGGPTRGTDPRVHTADRASGAHRGPPPGESPAGHPPWEPRWTHPGEPPWGGTTWGSCLGDPSAGPTLGDLPWRKPIGGLPWGNT